MSAIQQLLDQNEQSLDRVAFQIKVAQLLELTDLELRQVLAQSAVSTPVLCLALGADLLRQFSGLSDAYAGTRRRAVFYACRRALANLDQGS